MNEELVKRLHDRLGAMIDQVGQPDYSLRELVVGLRDIRDEMFSALTAQQEPAARQPTIDECYAAGVGPKQNEGEFREDSGLNTPDERARFEAYMRGHSWHVGRYDEAIKAYDTTLVRMLYSVWRDRGALPTTPPSGAREGVLRADQDHSQLMGFYGVNSIDALVVAQARHIEKLQSKLPPIKDDQPCKVREG